MSTTPPIPQRERGTALLLAMLVVALVATLSASAFWQQWQAWAVERAEQQRTQADWLLTGAQDWARFILREDARASEADHLGEPWAVPLQEVQLSTFLAANLPETEHSLASAHLTGSIVDLQGRLNLRNLIEGDEQQAVVSSDDLRIVRKLFVALNLPEGELSTLVKNLQAARQTEPDEQTPVWPARFEQLAWLGLSGHSLQVLAEHATWLPDRTPLNLNTCSALALYASVPGLEWAQAQTALTQRSRHPFLQLSDAASLLGSAQDSGRFAVGSRYFLVQGWLRLDEHMFARTSLVMRDGIQVRTLWSQTGPATPLPPSH